VVSQPTYRDADTKDNGRWSTNNQRLLEQYIDELLVENNEIKEEMEELKRENWELKEQNQKLRSRIHKRPNQTQVSTVWVNLFAVFNFGIQTAC